MLREHLTVAVRTRAGYDIILNTTGRDATEDFDEIGHSNSAREMLDKYLLGDFVVTPPPLLLSGSLPRRAVCVVSFSRSGTHSTSTSLQGSAEEAGKKPKVKVVSATTGYASSSPSTVQTAFRAALPILVVLLAVYFAFLRK